MSEDYYKRLSNSALIVNKEQEAELTSLRAQLSAAEQRVRDGERQFNEQVRDKLRIANEYEQLRKSLEQHITSLTTERDELRRDAERIKVALEDALPYIGNPANPSHIPRAAINKSIEIIDAALKARGDHE